jgi:peptidyl-prolyl cis-trans isomerase C
MTASITGTARSLGRRLRELRVPTGRRARIVVAAAVLVAVAAAGTGYVLSRAGLPEGAALQVADRLVTEQELERRTEILQALYGIQRPSDADGLDRFNRDVAKAIAVSMVLDGAARERDIVVSDKYARDILTRFIEQQFPEGGRDAFVQALGTFGASERDVLDEIKTQTAVGDLFEQITADVEVTDADVRLAYEQRRGELVTPEQRRVRNIVVTSRSEADTVLEQARSGADFAALVQQHSVDGSTRDAGGDLGLVTADVLEQEYAATAFTVGAGEYFGPVQTRNGWNVGQAAEVVAAAPLSFEQAQERVRQELWVERSSGTWRPWVSEQIRRADVEYAARYRPADPDAAPQVPEVGPLPGMGTALAGGPAPEAGAATADRSIGGTDATGNRSAALWLAVQSVLAVALLAFGQWGYRNAHRLAAAALPSDQRARSERTYRRSAVACQIVAGVFAAVTVAMAVTGIS